MAGSSPTHTLADLASWTAPGPSLAVLGFPIKHSISPAMHNAALAEMARSDARFASWRYHRFEIDPAELIEALPLFHAKGFLGLNLTVPHKVIAVEAIAQVDPAARLAGAVNTLRAFPGGWEGFNTDGYGLEAGVQEDLGVSLRGTPVILLGAGGAARGAAVQCLRSGCASLTLVNRTLSNLESLLRDLAAVRSRSPVRGLLSDSNADLPPGALVINATSAGLKAEDALPLDLRRVRSPLAAYDMIYNPRETRWLAQAKSLGIRHANGLSMLIHQGAAALSHWAARPVPVATMAAAARAALA